VSATESDGGWKHRSVSTEATLSGRAKVPGNDRYWQYRLPRDAPQQTFDKW
jgi:hypothetical protein